LQVDGADAHHQRVFHRLAEGRFLTQRLFGLFFCRDVAAGHIGHAAVGQRAERPDDPAHLA
jgi:hypothetical protein